MANFIKNKPQLPKSILEMKFMKRTKDRLDKEKRKFEDKKDIKPVIIESHDITSNFIIEPSYGACENLIEGRLSFKGMNPEIERLMELEKQTPEETDRDISDQDLARHFEQSKRKRDFIKNEEHVPIKKFKF